MGCRLTFYLLEHDAFENLWLFHHEAVRIGYSKKLFDLCKTLHCSAHLQGKVSVPSGQCLEK